MNKKFQCSLMILWLATFLLTAASCIGHVNGNGKVVKEVRNVSGFDAISVNNGIELLVSQDTFEKVVVEADENIQKILRTEVKDGKLKIFLGYCAGVGKTYSYKFDKAGEYDYYCRYHPSMVATIVVQ